MEECIKQEKKHLKKTVVTPQKIKYIKVGISCEKACAIELIL